MCKTRLYSALNLTKISLFMASAMITSMLKADLTVLDHTIDATRLQNTTAMATESERLANDDARIVPFEIAVSDQAIDDLKQRLANTRLPDQIANTSWEYGTDLSYLRELLDY